MTLGKALDLTSNLYDEGLRLNDFSSLYSFFWQERVLLPTEVIFLSMAGRVPLAHLEFAV